jgi:modification methylase
MRDRPDRTSTSAFGVGRREGHDSRPFYARFEPPELTAETAVEPLRGLPQGQAACIQADSSRMVLPSGERLPGSCVALVVTSPPYFVGKEYEQALGQGLVPGSYLDYLGMLRGVFEECKRVLEPGGRIAVNVANLGRKPYRSLAADVIRILQDDLHLLLRGEVIWRKAEGAGGSCAWGSFRSASNPVLRDVTERVIIASKGRFDRAKSVDERRNLDLPHESRITPDEFMAATLDVWDIPPESAKRVGHPAPFPSALPRRLIDLYTYRGDLVVDPFMGSGSTLVAAARSGRRYLGYDLDAGYVAGAQARLAEELRRPAVRGDGPADPVEEKAAVAGSRELLEQAGFRITHEGARQRGLGVTVDFIAVAADGRPWCFDVSGAFARVPAGLSRTDTVWKALGRAGVLVRHDRAPVVLLTSSLPRPRSEGDMALRAAGPGIVFDAMEIRSHEASGRLALYAAGGHDRPLPGFWTAKELADL